MIAAGTNTITYAATRYCLTRNCLEPATSATIEFLEAFGFLADPEITDGIVGQDKAIAGGTLVNQIRSAGGRYYWYNQSKAYLVGGAAMVVLGIGLPFVSRRRDDTREQPEG